MEDYVYILDYLPMGHPESKRFRKEPIAYGLGEKEFKILEIIPKKEVALTIGERVYIGKDIEKRSKILSVKRRIGYSDLTHTAQSELPYTILEIVKNTEARFVEFFNNAHPISTRLHMLELLPGLGKKTMWAILEERKKGPFTSFKDIEERVSSLHHVEKHIAMRIELEITDPDQKYHLFVAR